MIDFFFLPVLCCDYYKVLTLTSFCFPARSIGLDPDEEKSEEPLFANLHAFIERDMSPEEQGFLLGSTVPSMVQRALQLKQLKPASGLHFSLQQQGNRVSPKSWPPPRTGSVLP